MKIKTLNKVPKNTQAVIRWLGHEADRRGISAYAVGGFVRDLLLKRPSLDCDIVVEADALAFAQSLKSSSVVSMVRHRQFGTVTLMMRSGIKIDIATVRKETYERPGALPRVMPGTLFDDLFRRDFSINALALKINRKGFGDVVDYFSGLDDLRKGRIRILHDASFIDDPTRILRAIRFEQRFGFRLERDTARLLKQAVQKNMFKAVSPQRIFAEIKLLLKEAKPKRCMARLHALCGFGFIDSGIRWDASAARLFDRADTAIAWFQGKFAHRRMIDSWIVYLMVLLRNSDSGDARSFFRKYNMNRADQLRIASFVKLHTKALRTLARTQTRPSELFALLEPLSYEVIIALKVLAKKKIIVQRIGRFLSLYNGVRLQMSGSDLVAAGLKSGAHFSRILKKTLHAKIDRGFKKKSDELLYAGRLLKRV